MLTKEQKEKWLENLKSGKYKRIGQQLKDGKGGHCCLDVLAITIGIKTNGITCFDETDTATYYRPFNDLLTREFTNKLLVVNDNSVGIDYSAVIPIIEQLPTK